MGVRSMATFIRTEEVTVLIDPSAALAKRRFGKGPHPVEEERKAEIRDVISERSRETDIVVISHYHFDHYDPELIGVFKAKRVMIKHPEEFINRSQRGRAAEFLPELKRIASSVEIADGSSFEVDKVILSFSRAMPHGDSADLGFVVQTCIKEDDEVFLHSSDVQGLPLPEHIDRILDHRPQTILLDGPMKRFTEPMMENLEIAVEEGLERLVLDHHLLRDEDWHKWFDRLRERLPDLELATAAEFMGRPVETLELQRERLYEDHPVA